MAEFLEAVESGLERDDVAEDTNAVLMPDLFVLPRRLLCKEDGSFRPALRVFASIQAAVAVLVMGPLCIYYAMFEGHMPWRPAPQVVPDEMSPALLVELINQLGFGTIICTVSRYSGQLHRVICPGGVLERMGLGEKRVSEHAVKNLKRWMYMIPVVSAPCFLFFCFVFFTVFPSTIYMLIFNEPPGWFGEGGSVPPGGRPISLVFTIIMPCFAGMFFPGVPIGLVWSILFREQSTLRRTLCLY